jgi:hypothetical protein
METTFKQPILFLIFNRPDTTAQVFEKIRSVQPQKLYIAADGPRSGNERDIGKCTETRKIVESIDWDCKVTTFFRDKNLGCRIAVSSAITWFFEQEEQGIILEDDCLPHESFFTFCSELLEKYKSDERVMHIGGTMFLPDLSMLGERNASYYFSRDPFIWGWATWRRAWSKYDVELKLFPLCRSDGLIQKIFNKKDQSLYWEKMFEETFQGEINTWDYQWRFAILISSGLCIVPKVNMVTNIGFVSDATHTAVTEGGKYCLPVEKMSKIIHPVFQVCDSQADFCVYDYLYKNTLMRRISNKIRKIIFS